MQGLGESRNLWLWIQDLRLGPDRMSMLLRLLISEQTLILSTPVKLDPKCIRRQWLQITGIQTPVDKHKTSFNSLPWTLISEHDPCTGDSIAELRRVLRWTLWSLTATANPLPQWPYIVLSADYLCQCCLYSGKLTDRRPVSAQKRLFLNGCNT